MLIIRIFDFSIAYALANRKCFFSYMEKIHIKVEFKKEELMDSSFKIFHSRLCRNAPFLIKNSYLYKADTLSDNRFPMPPS